MISPITVFEPAAQPCALDRSSYSRRARRKSTAEANYFVSILRNVPQFPLSKNGKPPVCPRFSRSHHRRSGGLLEPLPNYESDLVENSSLGRVWFKLPKGLNAEHLDFSLGLPETSEVSIGGVAGLRAFPEPHCKMGAIRPGGVAVHHEKQIWK
jgi:hypothetical protein